MEDMKEAEVIAILDDLFTSIQRQDWSRLDAVMSDSFTVWINQTDETLDKSACLQALREVSKVAQMRFEVLERWVFAGGAAQRHIIHFNGSEITGKLPVAMFLRLANGQVTQVFEYFDHTQLPFQPPSLAEQLTPT